MRPGTAEDRSRPNIQVLTFKHLIERNLIL